jgi:hypothetical protein
MNDFALIANLLDRCADLHMTPKTATSS